MKRLFLIMTVVAMTVGCGAKTVTPSKNSATEHRKLQPFDEIEISSAIDVQFIQGSTSDYSAIIAAPSNVLPYFVLEQEGNEISMSLKGGIRFTGDSKVVVTLYAPSVKSVEVNGASSFNSALLDLEGKKFELEVNGASSVNIDPLTAAEVDIDASGASNVTISNLTATVVEAEASGASTIKLAGNAQKGDFEASGASSIKARDLKVVSGKVDASGASSIKASIQNVTKRESSGASSVSVN